MTQVLNTYWSSAVDLQGPPSGVQNAEFFQECRIWWRRIALYGAVFWNTAGSGFSSKIRLIFGSRVTVGAAICMFLECTPRKRNFHRNFYGHCTTLVFWFCTLHVTNHVPVSSQFLKFRRNFLIIPLGGWTGTTTSILTSSITCLCPHHFLKSNRNACQNPKGILTKMPPNFLLSKKRGLMRILESSSPLTCLFLSAWATMIVVLNLMISPRTKAQNQYYYVIHTIS